MRGVRTFVVAVAATAIAASGLTIAAASSFANAGDTAVVAAGQGGAGGSDGAPVAQRPRSLPTQQGGASGSPVLDAITPARNPPVMSVGSDGRSVRELQVRLGELGLFTGDITGYYGNVTKGAVAAYQTSKGEEATGALYEGTWAALKADTTEPTTAQMYPPPPNVTPPNVPAGALDPRCIGGEVLCIDKTQRVLRWVVDGRVLLQLDARFGSATMPTDEGVFHVFWKDRDHVSSVYESEMPFSMFFSGGQAVHYSQDFADVGYAGASHGCVNIRDYKSLEWLYDQVNTGDKVVVYRS